MGGHESSAREVADGSKDFWFQSTASVMAKIMPHFLARNHRGQTQALPCLEGQDMLVIDELGDVFPCEISGHFLGKRGY